MQSDHRTRCIRWYFIRLETVLQGSAWPKSLLQYPGFMFDNFLVHEYSTPEHEARHEKDALGEMSSFGAGSCNLRRRINPADTTQWTMKRFGTIPPHRSRLCFSARRIACASLCAILPSVSSIIIEPTHHLLISPSHVGGWSIVHRRWKVDEK